MRIPLSKGPSSFLQIKGFSGIKVTPFSHPCNRKQDADPKQLRQVCIPNLGIREVLVQLPTSNLDVSKYESLSPVEVLSSLQPRSWGCMLRSPPKMTTSAPAEVWL